MLINNMTPWKHEQNVLMVQHPISGKSLTYKQLIQDPLTAKVWSLAMCKELGRLSQVYKTVQPTDTFVFLSHEQIKNITRKKTITYARIVVDFQPQKKDPYRVRITVGDNLINYNGPVATTTADLMTSKLLWNSILSTDGARYITIDIHCIFCCAGYGIG